MATATPARTEPAADALYRITSDVFSAMIEKGALPEKNRIYLWNGSLFEKPGKSTVLAAEHTAWLNTFGRRLPEGLSIAVETSVYLDSAHVPSPDLVILKGKPFDFLDRWPDGRDVLVIVEVAEWGLSEALGDRPSRYASTLPLAAYIVADVQGRRILIHRDPIPATGDQPGRYESVETVVAGGTLRLTVDGVEMAPITYESLLP